MKNLFKKSMGLILSFVILITSAVIPVSAIVMGAVVEEYDGTYRYISVIDCEFDEKYDGMYDPEDIAIVDYLLKDDDGVAYMEDVAIPEQLFGQCVVALMTYPEEDAYALANVKGIVNLTLPTYLMYIEEGALCEGISRIEVSEDNQYFIVEDGLLLSSDKSILYYATAEAGYDVVIPQSVKKIAAKAFKGSDVTTVKLPRGLEDIGESAFENCANLKYIAIPDSVKTVGSKAFYGSGVSQVFIPAHIEPAVDFIDVTSRIDLYSFGDLNTANNNIYEFYALYATGAGSQTLYKNLYEETFTEEGFTFIIKDDMTVQVTGYVSLEDEPFSLSIPNAFYTIEVSSVAENAFYTNDLINSIDLSDSEFFRSESGVLFNADMTKLIIYPAGKADKSYIVPSSVLKLGDYAFAGNKNLAALIIPKHLSAMKATTLKNCSDVLTITIAPDVVTNVKTSAVSFDKIKITWDKVLNADGYRIYKYSDAEGEYKLINTVYGDATTSYIDTFGIALGNSYIYAVEAYKETDYGLVTADSGYDEEGVVGASALNVPKISSISSPSYNKIKLTWNVIDGAEQGYVIYRTTSSSGTGWKKIGTTSNINTTTYTDSTVTCGTKYYYTVRAVRGTIMSSYDKKGKGCTATLSTPKLTSATASAYNAVTVKWGKVSGATGYYVYRSTKPTSGWTKIATIKSGSTVSYKNTGLTCGKKYYYTVTAYRTVSGKTFKSKYTTPGIEGIPLTTAPSLKSAKSASYNSIKLTWGTVSGASGYRIYRRVNGTSKWSTVATVGSSVTTYTDKGLACGTKYDYSVRSYRKVSGSTIWGLYNTTGIQVTPVPATPAISSAKVVALNKIKLTWNKISGASGYYVYRSKKASSGFVLIGTVTSGSTITFTDTEAQYNAKYYYTVCAYRTVNGTNVKGSYKTPGTMCAMIY